MTSQFRIRRPPRGIKSPETTAECRMPKSGEAKMYKFRRNGFAFSFAEDPNRRAEEDGTSAL